MTLIVTKYLKCTCDDIKKGSVNHVYRPGKDEHHYEVEIEGNDNSCSCMDHETRKTMVFNDFSFLLDLIKKYIAISKKRKDIIHSKIKTTSLNGPVSGNSLINIFILLFI